MKQWVDGIETWTYPVTFSEHKTVFNGLWDTYLQAVRNIRRHDRALEKVSFAAKASKQEGARKFRTNRDRVRDYYVGKEVPEAIASVVGNRLYSRIVRPESRGITSVKFVNVVEDLPNNSAPESRQQPILFQYDAAVLDETLSDWARQCAEMYRDNKNAVVPKMREASQQMAAANPTRASAVSALDVVTNFEFNVQWSKEDPWFIYTATRQAIWTSWTEQCVTDPTNWPFRFMPGLLTQYVGQSVVVIIDSATMLENGGEATVFINGIQGDILSKFPTTVLTEGSSLWLPFGSMPIIVGNSMPVQNVKEVVDLKERVIGKQLHSMALGFTPVLDCSVAAAASDDTRRMIASWMLRALPTIPPTWKSAEGQVTLWNAALKVS